MQNKTVFIKNISAGEEMKMETGMANKNKDKSCPGSLKGKSKSDPRQAKIPHKNLSESSYKKR